MVGFAKSLTLERLLILMNSLRRLRAKEPVAGGEFGRLITAEGQMQAWSHDGSPVSGQRKQTSRLGSRFVGFDEKVIWHPDGTSSRITY